MFQSFDWNVWDLINRFNPSAHSSCPKPELGFPRPYVMIFVVFDDLIMS
jgi:hypothetical protein